LRRWILGAERSNSNDRLDGSFTSSRQLAAPTDFDRLQLTGLDDARLDLSAQGRSL